MTSPLSFMIGLKPTGLGDFVNEAQPTGLYCLNQRVRELYPNVLTVLRIQNDVWGRLPDACGVDRYFEKEDPIASANYELLEKRIFVPLDKPQNLSERARLLLERVLQQLHIPYTARGANLNLTEYWLLSQETWYAPYNEWDLGEGDDRFAKADWMNAWTCRAQDIAHEHGARLCIGSFASGGPKLDVLPHLYPMLQAAKKHGDIFDCHAYGIEGALRTSPSSGALYYREIYAALPVDCRVPFVLSEFWWGNGFEATGDVPAQMADAQWYGQEIVRDDYVLWASAFQLSEGAESDFTSDAVTAYAQVASEIQRTGGQSVAQIIGVNSRSNGGDLTALDKATIQLAMPRLNGYKFLTSDARNNHGALVNLGVPAANCINRLYWDVGNISTLPTAQDFYNQVCRTPVLEMLADQIFWLEFLNEVNLSDEWKWGVSTFVTWSKSVIQILRQNHPALKIISPGLSPNATTPTWDDAFASGGVYAACDGIGAHAYGSKLEHVDNNDELRYYRRFQPRLTGTQKIWITEASLKFYTCTPREVGLLYGQYATTLEPYVAGVFFFTLQGDAFASSGEEWVTRQDIPRGLKDYVPTLPPPDLVFDGHYNKATGALISRDKDYQFNLTANTSIETRFAAAQPPVTYTFQHSVVPASAAARVTVTPQPGTHPANTSIRIIAT
jgi:hypothetical protein